MDPHFLPVIPVYYDKQRDQFIPPEDRLDDLERDRRGAEEDSFDTESASYMDKEGVIAAKRRTDYAPGQTGCGSNFSSEAQRPKGGKC